MQHLLSVHLSNHNNDLYNDNQFLENHFLHIFIYRSTTWCLWNGQLHFRWYPLNPVIQLQKGHWRD